MAWKACGHGWFLISALTSPLTSLPRMMVRPLKAAKPATTSAMLARSQVTVIRGSSARVTMAMLRMLSSAFRAGTAAATGVTSAGIASAASVTSAADGRDFVVRRPGLEALARAEAHANGVVRGPVDLVGLRALEIDHDADDVGPELRVAEVHHPAPLHAVVQRGGGAAELGADHVEHQPVGRAQEEVADIDGAADS